MSTKVIGVKELDETIDEADVPDDGIVSSRFVLWENMLDEDLDCIFENDPELVIAKRPDYVARRHPAKLH